LLINQLTLQDPLMAFRPSSIVYLLIAFGFGTVTSIVSGLYPEWKAANERPVEALRK
jgi:putative ABC transport system permease protein